MWKLPVNSERRENSLGAHFFIKFQLTKLLGKLEEREKFNPSELDVKGNGMNFCKDIFRRAGLKSLDRLNSRETQKDIHV